MPHGLERPRHHEAWLVHPSFHYRFAAAPLPFAFQHPAAKALDGLAWPLAGAPSTRAASLAGASILKVAWRLELGLAWCGSN